MSVTLPDVSNRAQGNSLSTIDISAVARRLWVFYLGNYLLLFDGLTGALGVAHWYITVAFSPVFSVMKFPAAGIALNVGIGLGYGWCAVVGWRTAGKSLLAARRTNVAALIVLAGLRAFNLVSILRLIQDYGLAKVGGAVGVTLIYVVLKILLCVGSLAAVKSAARMTCQGLNVNLTSLLESTLGQGKTHAARLPARSRWKGVGCLVGGVVWLLAFSLIPHGDPLRDANTLRMYQLENFGYLWLIYAKHYFQSDYEAVVAHDQRPIVLFLRSFSDDTNVYDHSSLVRRLFSFSLESLLADYFTYVGPCVAVGNPRAKGPQLGAARKALSEEEWQATVLGWIGSCQAIVFMAGISEWASWELGQLVRLEEMSKLIVAFPAARMEWWRFWERGKRDKNSYVRHMLLQVAFSGTIWEPGLAQIREPHKLRSIFFAADGTVEAVVSKPAGLVSFLFGAVVAHYLMLRGQQERSVDVADAQTA